MEAAVATQTGLKPSSENPGAGEKSLALSLPSEESAKIGADQRFKTPALLNRSATLIDANPDSLKPQRNANRRRFHISAFCFLLSTFTFQPPINRPLSSNSDQCAE